MKRRDLLRSVPGALLVTTELAAGDDDEPTEPATHGRSVRRPDGSGRHDYDRASLRAIAASLDDEKPAERVRGNGPPVADHRQPPLDPATVEVMERIVDQDPLSVDPPMSLTARTGEVDLKKLDKLVTYDGVRYLDAPPPRKGDDFRSQYFFTGAPPTGEEWYEDMYRYGLLFSYLNAYDLGMVNRTGDNDSIPDGYTDKGIVESHRFPDGDEDHRSLRAIVDRHREGVRHRVLWQNAYLPASRIKPEKARTIGRRIAEAGYDVVGLCEVYDDNLLSEMEDAYGERYAETERQYGFWRLYDLGVLLGTQHRDESRVKRRLGDGDSDRYYDNGPTGGGSVNLEGWQHAPVQVPDLPGAPAFELFVTHLQNVSSALGEDDFGDDAKQRTKLNQLEELTRLIDEFQSGPNGHRPILLMGDFNIHSAGRGSQLGEDDGVLKGQYYSNFMHEMRTVGMQNAWLTHGGPNADCQVESDGYTCKSFVSEDQNPYYRGSWLDYVFVERPRRRHDLHLDVSRMRAVAFDVGEYELDHVGIGFELLTSPAD